MRKALIVLLFFTSVISFADVYHHAQQAAVQDLKYAARHAGRSFLVNPSPLLAGPDGWSIAYPLLHAAAEETGVNVFRTSLGYSRDKEQEITHYVLLTGPTRFTDALQIEDGRYLTPEETEQGRGFLSTDDTGRPDQVGRLTLFGPGPRAEIRPLQQADTYLPAPGRYWVEAPTPETYDAFVQRFTAAVNERLPQDAPRRYTPEDFKAEPTAGGTGGAVENFGIWGHDLFKYVPQIRYLAATITLVLLVYYSFQIAKRIGILKMHGASNLRVWYAGAGRLVIGMFLLSFCLSLAAAMVTADNRAAFALDVARSQATLYGLMVFASLVLYLYSARVRISDAIKHRKDTAGIFGMNLLIKAGWSIMLVVLIAGVWFQLAGLRQQEALYQHWQRTPQPRHYGIFSPMSVGHDLVGTTDGLGMGSRAYARAQELYPLLNAEGALYINANQYHESNLRLPLSPGFIRSIRVNPNYLRQFPLRDVDQQPVEIGEGTTDWVILVPRQFRDREQQILSFFQERRRLAISNVDQITGAVVPEQVRAQQVRIVWLAPGQRVFSLDPAVFPDEGNAVVDPIIEVMTEQNSLFLDRLNVTTGNASAALKVPLIEDDPALTYQHWQPQLERLGLSDGMRQLQTVNQAIASQIETLRRLMAGLAAVIVMLIGASLLLVTQNLTIYFTRYRQRIMVRRLFGAGLIRTYKGYVLLFTGAWAVQSLIGLAVVYQVAIAGPPGAAPPATTIIVPVLAIIAVLVALELAGSAAVIRRIEHRGLPEALKEGT